MSDSGLIRGTGTPRRVLTPVGAEPIPVGAARRFSLGDDIDQWLLDRVMDRWPGYPEQSWRSRLGSFASSNGHFFVTNDRCVLLMTVACAHAITGKTIVMEVFALSRDAHFNKDDRAWVLPNDAHAPMAALYRAGKEWMKAMGAARMIAGTCSDMAPSGVKNATGGYYIVDWVNGL
jgi:hypothetical protein